MSKKGISVGLLSVGILSMVTVSSAKIYFDHEVHPMPLVDVTVVLPVGFETTNPAESGAGNLLSDIFENGTAKLDRQAFLDKLGDYGANLDFAVSNQFSYWHLTFPVVEGKDYSGLADLLAENWQTPRFTKEAFDTARVKLEATLTGSLDSDMSLGVTTARRWLNKRDFGGSPVFVDTLPKLTLPVVQAVYERDFRNVSEIWAGVVAPAASADTVKSLLSKVFLAQGDVVTGKHLEKLKVHKVDASKAKNTETLLIIDKPGRNQTVTSLIGVRPSEIDGDRELSFMFGNHILVDSGLGSVFSDEIRNKRGLAYSVGGVPDYYLGMPVIGFAANPVRPRTEEAFGVVASLLKSSYDTGKIFAEIPDEAWNRQWQSFRYARILERSTPMGRINERMSIVTGTLSSELYEEPIEDWKVSRKDVQKYFENHWSDSTRIMTVVGEAGELRPLAQKFFPKFEVKIIPYKETIRSSGYSF